MVDTTTRAELAPTTPVFVIDRRLLETFVGRFRRALDAQWPGAILSYSFKTNSLPWLLAHMRREGVWAEVVSDAEYDLALALGYDPARIVFNGPVKSRDRLRFALRAGSVVNLDSKREIEYAAELAREEPSRSVAVGLRVNWDLEARCPGESTTGSEGSRFGFDVDNGDLDRVIRTLTDAGARVVGLHMHRNSSTQSLDVYRAAATVAAEIIASRRLELDWVDIGGGFFGSLEGRPTFEDYVRVIRETLEPVVDVQRTRLVVEPGGSLIALPVEFHASVLDVKDVGPRRHVVTDASRTDIDPLFRRRRPFAISTDATSEVELPEQIIDGFTCMEDDRLTRLHDARELAVGDRLVFAGVGAYTMSYQSTFIEFPPAVYVRDGQTFTQVRRRWGAADYLRGNDWETEAREDRESIPTAAGMEGAAGAAATAGTAATPSEDRADSVRTVSAAR
ncbi:hypothetical protein DEO23_10085 [Brachybacterium endophyticum]|uniref:Orn/DAP/Arg decarboxylase 2 N-terminal domain-containing protein n=1 Tax=Brachybacterium endophyticum TaxID=2182385 RepID=A0A2U2RK15_9MICO|nr:hypothetical protein [Brachybacterium endophyticum]PWH06145.1 hypothetical protein DEO23_10085 [Brachybacterium endophyticum]